MAQDKATHLTESEWKVMRIVWSINNDCTARDVYTIAAKDYNLAPTTVKTFLSFLVDKGYLATKKTGNKFVYRAKRTINASLRQAADNLVGKSLEGTQGEMLVNIIKKCKLSAAEIADIKKAL